MFARLGALAIGATAVLGHQSTVPVDEDPASLYSDWGTLSATQKAERLVQLHTIEQENAAVQWDASNQTASSQPEFDCVMSLWSPWTGCAKTCGAGTKLRTRSVLMEPSAHGARCPVKEESVVCATQPCPHDCEMSPWTQWSPCTKSCGTGSSNRTQTPIQLPSYGGVACPTGLWNNEFQSCNVQPCPVDCTVGEWGDWSICSRSCGTGANAGHKYRRRHVTHGVASGGKHCPHVTDVEPCNNSTLCPMDCELAPWTAWDTCSLTCDGGTQKKTRAVLRYEGGLNGGKACAETSQTRECNTHSCGCEVGPWALTVSCSVTCGGGQETYERPQLTEPVMGHTCPPLVKHVPCNMQGCPACAVHPPSLWTDCTQTCGSGVQHRTQEVYSLTGDAQTLGACSLARMEYCDAVAVGVDTVTEVQNMTVNLYFSGNHIDNTVFCANKHQKCNKAVCPIDCAVSEWSEWGACSKDCRGQRRSSRTVVTDMENNGQTCPDTERFEACNPVCPEDCEVGDWTQWSTCSSSCGETGSTHRTRNVIHPAIDETGVQCPILMDTAPCNRHSCQDPICHAKHASCAIYGASPHGIIKVVHDKKYMPIEGDFHCKLTGADGFPRLMLGCECRCTLHPVCCSKHNYVLGNAELIGGIYRNVTDQGECCSACTHNSECGSWEYHVNTKVCNLKKGEPEFIKPVVYWQEHGANASTLDETYAGADAPRSDGEDADCSVITESEGTLDTPSAIHPKYKTVWKPPVSP